MDKKLTVRPTEIQGVFVVETAAYNDHREAFARLFCADELACSAAPSKQGKHLPGNNMPGPRPDEPRKPKSDTVLASRCVDMLR